MREHAHRSRSVWSLCDTLITLRCQISRSARPSCLGTNTHARVWGSTPRRLVGRVVEGIEVEAFGIEAVAREMGPDGLDPRGGIDFEPLQGGVIREHGLVDPAEAALLACRGWMGF